MEVSQEIFDARLRPALRLLRLGRGSALVVRAGVCLRANISRISELMRRVKCVYVTQVKRAEGP